MLLKRSTDVQAAFFVALTLTALSQLLMVANSSRALLGAGAHQLRRQWMPN
jgi:hypothetical protein